MFFIFSAQAPGGEGGTVFIENPGGGWGFQEGKGRGAGGGGAKYFLGGAETSTK